MWRGHAICMQAKAECSSQFRTSLYRRVGRNEEDKWPITTKHLFAICQQTLLVSLLFYSNRLISNRLTRPMWAQGREHACMWRAKTFVPHESQPQGEHRVAVTKIGFLFAARAQLSRHHAELVGRQANAHLNTRAMITPMLSHGFPCLRSAFTQAQLC